jgi:alkylated DNA repair dioxygenase AlkB
MSAIVSIQNETSEVMRDGSKPPKRQEKETTVTRGYGDAAEESLASSHKYTFNVDVDSASKYQSRLSVLQLDDEEIALLARCVDEAVPLLVEKPLVHVRGRQCHQQRNVGFFSDTSVGYAYSRQLSPSIPLTANIRQLLAKVNDMHNTHFNGILVNQYCDGSDYISAHSDDERNLSNDTVVGISYGAPRIFRIRQKQPQTTSPKYPIVTDVVLQSGMMFTMSGNFQKEFTHEIPPQKKIQGVRVSFTFRTHAL